MEILDIISYLLKQQEKKQKELTDYLGISKYNYTDKNSSYIRYAFRTASDFLPGYEAN